MRFATGCAGPGGSLGAGRTDRGISPDIPATDRRDFVCRYWYLDPIEDIAKQFGFTKSKVKSMLHRTRKKLRTYLEKEGIEL